MRNFLFFLLLSATGTTVFSQTPYTSSPDEKHPEVTVLNGIITKYILQNSPAFNWYGSNQNIYEPPATAVNAMEAAKDSFQFILFGGTWCEDTQFVLPKFFKIQEKSGVPDETITFFAVNRAKKTLSNISAAFNVTLVPTIIVMKDGKEIGRVVEYGKTGKWDKELVDILNQ